MARFPAQGSGGGGGAGTGHVIQDEGSGLPQQPILDFIGDGVTASDGTGKTEVNIPGGGGGVVEKLGGEIKLDSSTNVFTIPITPNRLITDYSEFWVIFNGQVVSDDDIFMQINGFTSSSYDNVIDTISQNPLTRELAGSISQNKVIGFFGTNEQVTALGSCYIKWRIGAKKTGNDALMCSIESTHGNIDVGVSVMRGSHGMGKLDGFNDANLEEIRVQTTSNNFQVGSSCQVYGVLNEGGGSGGGGSGLEILDTALLQEEFYWRELQGGGVVKLFETTTQTLVNSILATIDPVVNFNDYAEFWLIVSARMSAQNDIFAQINSFTSSEYGTYFNRVDASNGMAPFSNNGASAWILNNSVNAEPVLANQQIYSKLTLQGGTFDQQNRRNGQYYSMVRASGVDKDPSMLTGGIELTDVTDTTISQFRVFTGGANFLLGTKVSVYGVSPIEGAFRQKYHVTGFVRPVGEDIQDLGVIKLETPGVNGAGFAGILGDPSSIDTGKIGPPTAPATADESGFRVSTITRRNVTMKQVLTVIDSVNSMVAVGLVETTPNNALNEAEFLAFQNNGFGFIFSVVSPFWRIWTKQLGALTIQTTTVAPTNGINVRQTLEAKIILQSSGTPHIEYRIDGVLVGTLETNDPQSSALIMYSGVFGTDTLTTTKELDIDTWEVQVDRLLT